MACTSITLNGLGVGCKDSMGGLKEVYIIKHDYITSVTVGTGNMITAISTKTLASSTDPEKFKTYQFRKQTSSFSSNLTSDETVGTFSVQTDLSLQFTKMTTLKSTELMGILLEGLAVIVKDQNNKYWYLGYDNYVYASSGTAQSGTAIGDLNGYNITLTDISNRFPYEVDPDIITSSLVDDVPLGD